jgi:dipeptidase
MNDIPNVYRGGSIKELDLNSAFWIFNLVANLAYTKYSYISKTFQVVQKRLESKYEMFQPIIERRRQMSCIRKIKARQYQFLSDFH